MYMDSGQGDTSIKHKEKHADNSSNQDDEHDLLFLGNKPDNERGSSSTSSTSSDDSSEDDFFQLDGAELGKSVLGSSKMTGTEHGDNAHLASEFWIQRSEAIGIDHSSKHGAVDLSEFEAMLAGSRMPIGRSLSTYVTGATPGSDLSILGARQSPPLQVMERSDVPDPNRIPASVFARSKSATPMEWSVASNESLFSIHVGNSSFSRDHVILLGRSGELGNFYSGPLDGPTPPISPLGGSSPVTVDLGHGLVQPCATEAANAEAMKDVLRAAAEEHAGTDHPQADGVLSSMSLSRHSDGSTTSFRSFAFPILTGEGRSGSIKVEPEPQKTQFNQPQQPPLQQTKNPKAALFAGGNRWFPCSCFSCRPLCC